MISALTTSPDHLLGFPLSKGSANAWSDSGSDNDNDCPEDEQILDEDEDDSNAKTPVRRLQGQTLFLESDDDDDDDNDNAYEQPIERRSSDSATTAPRSFQRSDSDSPLDYTRSSWTSSSTLLLQQQQPISRTRRSSRARRTTSETESQMTTTPPSGFSIPEHRRRNSTGTGKSHSSPNPHSGGRNVTPLRSSQMNNNNTKLPPNSNSKSRKKHKNVLEMPGLLLEDRLSLHSKSTGSPSTSSSSLSLSLSSAPGRSSMGTWLCRIRLTTFIWGLVIIGATILGKSAMIASDSAMRLQALSSSTSLQPPTGGLRGSLLLATVGRNGKHHSHSKDLHPPVAVVAKKESKGKEKKKKDKKPVAKTDKPAKAAAPENPKHHQHQHQHHKKQEGDNSATKHAMPLTTRPIVYPKPIGGVRRTFEDQDTAMYAQPAQSQSLFSSLLLSASTAASANTPKQVVVLNQDIVKTPSSLYEVEQYPADFTDNTQYYGQFDSSDEHLQTMELREPYEDGECVPMQDWQTTYHPSCNGVHELGMEYLGEKSSENNVHLFGTKGYWRYAWRLDLRRKAADAKSKKQHNQDEYGDTVVLKTLK
jgi:hypothetical protein